MKNAGARDSDTRDSDTAAAPGSVVRLYVPLRVDPDYYFKKVKTWCEDNNILASMILVDYVFQPIDTAHGWIQRNRQMWSVPHSDQRMLFILKWCL